MNATVPLSLPIPETRQHTRTAATAVSKIASVAVAAIGVVVLIGWAAHIEALKSIVPGLIVMLPNPATGFVVGGAALWLLLAEKRTWQRSLLAQAFSTFVLLLGVFTFLERLFGFDFHIDLLLFASDVVQYPYQPPGQMASNSALCFTLAGAALLCLEAEPRRSPIWREALSTAGVIIGLMAILGYMYGAAPLYSFDPMAGMALLTALAFTFLHSGILFARPQRGYAALIAGMDVTAKYVRRLLLATLIVPVIAGWIYVSARESDVVSREGGAAMLMAFTTFVLFSIVLQSGRMLRAAALEREALLERERDLRAVAEAAQQQAEEADKFKSTFLTTMSHELRTPLNAIIGYSGLMAEGVTGAVTDKQLGHIHRIRVSAQHLLTLIDQILGISRLEAGKDRIAVRAVNVQDLLHETVAIAEPLFLNRALTLKVADPPSIMLRTDADRVRQILLNLISNAVKFSERGEICVSVSRTPDRVRLSVSDQGVGIQEAHLERIFEPFWQVEMNTTRRHQGIGLGLSVSRQLARLLGGDLTVRSAVNAGSTFTLELPIETMAPPS